MHHPKIYLVFWGPDWPSDPNGSSQNAQAESAYINLFNSLAGTSYNNLLSHYTDSTSYVHNDVTLAGAVVDLSPPSALLDYVGAPGYAAESGEIDYVKNAESWSNDSDTLWILMPQSGATYADTYNGGVSSWCGYHAYDPVDYWPTSYIFAVEPYYTDPAFSPQTGNVTCTFQNLDFTNTVTELVSHEYAEAATDPQIDWLNTTAWVTNDSHAQEIGDLCNRQWAQDVPGISSAVQELWENNGGQVDSGAANQLLDPYCADYTLPTFNDSGLGISNVVPNDYSITMTGMASSVVDLHDLTLEVYQNNVRVATFSVAVDPPTDYNRQQSSGGGTVTATGLQGSTAYTFDLVAGNSYGATTSQRTAVIFTSGLNLSPTNATVVAGTGQAYTTHLLTNGSVGDVTSATSFTIDGAACSGSTCTSAAAGTHVITATDANKTTTTNLTVIPSSLASIALSPAVATIATGSSQTYVATGFDQYGNPLGDQTAASAFVLSPDGTCSASTCTATTPVLHYVTATQAGVTSPSSNLSFYSTITHIHNFNALHASGGATNLSFGVNYAATAGDLLVGTFNGGGQTVLSVSDSVNGAWTKISCQDASNQFVCLYYFPNSAQTTANNWTIYVTLSSPNSNTLAWVDMDEFSGVSGLVPTSGCSNSCDQATSIMVGQGSTSATLPSTNPITDGELVYATGGENICCSNNQVTFSAGTTNGTSMLLASNINTTAMNAFSEYALSAAGGPQDASVGFSAALNANTNVYALQATFAPQMPATQLDLSTTSSTVTAGVSQGYTDTASDSSGTNLGDMTAATAYWIAPDGTCNGSACVATTSGVHTVTADYYGVLATATLDVNPAALDHITITPAPASTTPNGSQAYVSTGYDQYNNSRGNLTSSTTFTISPAGSCTGATCTVTVPGPYTVTGSDPGLTSSASLQVNPYIQHVQSATRISVGSQNSNPTFPNPVHAGDLLVGTFSATNGTPSSVSDSANGAWTRAACNGEVCVYYLANSHAVSSLTVTWSWSGQYIDNRQAVIDEFSGAAYANVLNQSTTGSANGTSLVMPASAAIPAYELVYASGETHGSSTYAAGTTNGVSMAIGSQASGGNGSSIFSEYSLTTLAGPQNSSITWDTTATTYGLQVTFSVQPATLAISPASTSMVAGSSQTFSATASDAYSNSLGDVSSHTTFSISPDGSCAGAICTATATGPHTVTASNAGATATAALTVNAGPLASITLNPASASIVAGASQAYTATAYDAYSNSRGNVTTSTTFAISPDGSCTVSTCTTTTVGSHTITAAYSGVSATAILTVTTGPLASITLSPNSTTMATGGSQAYSAAGFDQYGNSLGDATSQTTFTIAPDGSCSTVTCTTTLTGVHTITGTDSGFIASATLTVNGGTLSSLTISPASSSITAGTSQTYASNGFNQYGQSLGVVTSLTTFTIAPDGSCAGAVCTATASGTHTVTATDSGVSTTVTLTVNAAGLASITLSPASTSMTAGSSQTYAATGFDTYGNSLGDLTTSTVFTVTPNGSCSGAACTATLAGTHTVTGTNSTKTATTTLTVNAGATVSLGLTPVSSSIVLNASQAYIATGLDTYSNPTSALTSATTFTIAPNGSCTTNSCTASTTGSHTVTGTDGSLVSTASLTVNPYILHVQSNSFDCYCGNAASLTYASPVVAGDLLIGTFGADNGAPTAVSDNHNGAWTQGPCSGHFCVYYKTNTQVAAANSLTVTWSYPGGYQKEAAIDEFSGVALAPPDQSTTWVSTGTGGYSSSMVSNPTASIPAHELVYASGGHGNPATYTAGTTNGVAMAIGAQASGFSSIFSEYALNAAAGSQNASVSGYIDNAIQATFRVQPASVTISPSSASFTAGGQQTYTATAYDASGISLGDATSSTAFSITPDGSCTAATCTAAIGGPHTVTGANAGKTATASLQVNGTLDRITLSPATSSIAAGGSQAYTATAYNAAGQSIGDVTASTTFTIAPNGSCPGSTCTVTQAGAHTITGAYGGKTSTSSLTVTVGSLSSVSLSPVSASMVTNASQTFTATGVDSYGNSLGDLTSQTTFTISPNGSCAGATCTASATGIHTVTATYSGHTATSILAVGSAHLLGYPSTVSTNSPKGYYRLGESSGSFVDTSGNNNSLSVTGSPSYSQSGAIAGDSSTAAAFPSHARASSSSTCNSCSASSLTVEAWVKASPGQDGIFIDVGNSLGNHNGFAVSDSYGRIQIREANPSYNHWFTPSVTTVDGRWHLVDVVLASDLKVYVDGVLIGTESSSSRTIGNPSASFTIGDATYGAAGNCNSDTCFSGALDEVAVYGVSLSASQITADYNAGLTPAAAVAAITLSPASTTMAAGASQTYTSTALDQYGNSLGAVTGSSVFSITPNGSCTASQCTATAAGTHTVTGAYAGKTATASLTVNPGSLSSIAINPSASTIAAGSSQTYAATAFDAYNNSRGDVTASTTFTISPDGSCTGAACTTSTASTHTVTATYSGLTVTSGLTVNPAALASLAVSPTSSAITAGSSQAYAVTGYDTYANSLGSVLPGTTLTISPDGSCTGASCTATIVGVHTITATDSGHTITASLTVNAGALDHLVLSPASVSITAGDAQTYIASGADASGNPLGDLTSSATFSISPDGSCTGSSCSATTAGSHTVTATYSTKTGTAALTVTVASLDHITISPASSSVAAGVSQTYTATGYDTYNNSLGSVTSATTFTISPDGSCSAAACNATLAGSHTITGTNASLTATATLTVTAGALASITISPAAASIAAGDSQTYTASGLDAYGNSLGDVTSSTVFTITPDGSCTGAVCTASVPGAHTVSGADSGFSATATLTVT